MKKGFTLIELLAVILILGIITLIAIPKISDVIKESKTNSYKLSKDNILKAIQDKCTVDKINNKEITRMYTIENNKITPKIEINGEIPFTGKIYVSDDCEVNMNMSYENSRMIHINGIEQTFEKNDNNDIVKDEITERFIYKGSNPDNYILLDNVYYRIISYETDGTIKVKLHVPTDWGTFDERLSRKNTSNSYCNNTNSCNIYGSITGTVENGTAKGEVVSNSSVANRMNNLYNSFSAELKNAIVLHEFNMGGVPKNFSYCNDYDKLDELESAIKWKGYIGLITMSDFFKASLNDKCASASEFKNYMLNGEMFAFMNPVLNTYDQIHVFHWEGTEMPRAAYANANGVNLYPVFYLRKGTKLSGDGTKNKPFKLSA